MQRRLDQAPTTAAPKEKPRYVVACAIKSQYPALTHAVIDKILENPHFFAHDDLYPCIQKVADELRIEVLDFLEKYMIDDYHFAKVVPAVAALLDKCPTVGDLIDNPGGATQ